MNFNANFYRLFAPAAVCVGNQIITLITFNTNAKLMVWKCHPVCMNTVSHTYADGLNTSALQIVFNVAPRAPCHIRTRTT